MVALPAVSKVIRVDLHQTFDINTNVQNRLFFRFTGTMSSTDLATLCTTIRNAWNTNMAPVLTTGHTLTSVVATDLSSNTGAQQVNSTASVGTVADTKLTTGAAMVIKFKIGIRYRGGHPRIYLAGLGIARLSNTNNWNWTAITAILTA